MQCTNVGRLFVVLTALLLFPCATLLAQDYAIQLERPEKVGRKDRISVSASRSLTKAQRAGGSFSPVASESRRASAELVRTVLAVDGRGAPTSVSMQFDRLESSGGSLLEKGSIVTGSGAGGGAVFTINGKPLSKEAADALAILNIMTLKPGATNADMLFGTAEKKRIGESWPINAERLARDLGATGFAIDRASAEGAASLEGSAKSGNLDCLKISATAEVNGFVPANMPSQARLLDSSYKVAFKCMAPADTAAPCPESSLKTELLLTMRGVFEPAGPETTVEQRLDQSWLMKRVEVK